MGPSWSWRSARPAPGSRTRRSTISRTRCCSREPSSRWRRRRRDSTAVRLIDPVPTGEYPHAMKSSLLPGVALALPASWPAACKRAPNVQSPVQGFVVQLKDPNPEVHQKAAVDLMKVGQPAAEAVGALLADPDPALRSRAASVIWGMGAKGAAAAPSLAAALSDPQGDVRIAAAMALENMG